MTDALKIDDGLATNLEQLLQSFNISSPDLKAMKALADLCEQYGHRVLVSNATRLQPPKKGTRNFLITFKTSSDALRFANLSHQKIFGHDGVMIEVA
jgi:hypothetical protein